MTCTAVNTGDPIELRTDIWVADSVTRLGPQIEGKVLIGGSHCGTYAAYLAARANVCGVILNDAGIGLEQAGIAGLEYLDRADVPAAAIDYRSARIGNGRDTAARGIISFVNKAAQRLGCMIGQDAFGAAVLMRGTPTLAVVSRAARQSRRSVQIESSRFLVWALDSASLVKPDDKGQIIVTASHGGLLSGRRESALKVNSFAAFYNDAGVGCDDAGISRLPELDRRGVIAGTVSHWTARIGDGCSSWKSGILSHINRSAERAGATPGMSLRQFIREIAC